jgi:8-oxo-dGTP pyrophosphatase MutT (NUDIX family)
LKSDREATIQYAALPWRNRGDGIEIMLLTSRETRRWVIPKGWPMEQLAPAECALQEAFEEGGIRGTIGDLIGEYRYDKSLKDGSVRHLTVQVFPLEVTSELILWPEAKERDRRWFPAASAADAVAEPELSDLIRNFNAASAPPRT